MKNKIFELYKPRSLEEFLEFYKNNPKESTSDVSTNNERIEINVKKMNIDMMSISAHKFYGPKGIGALYIRQFPRIRLTPLIDGGGQEISLRSGTLPVPLCIGFGEAAKISMSKLREEKERTKKLRDYYYKNLKKNIKNIFINGHVSKRLPANLNISIPGIN